MARPGDWPPAIRLMHDVFRAAGRPARLEFIEERWPDLALALDAAGFVRRQRMPVMVLDGPAAGAPATGVELLGPGAAPGLVAATLDALNAAFGQAMTDATRAAETAQLAAELATGRCRVAVVRRDGRPVAGACLVGAGDAAELAGVWTAAGHRRQGLGMAVCRALLDSFLAGGGRFAWLGAHDDAAHDLYARLGFRAVGHQLDFSGPDA
ncbi:MAG: GNAT family N-acetyltransferase [Geminicoccaceae bacterium]